MDTELAKIMFDQTVEKYHKAMGEFYKGNAQPILAIFSVEEDVSLSNPVGPTRMGRNNISDAEVKVASTLREGQVTGFESLSRFVSCDFAYLIENEHYQTKVGGKPDFDEINLRVTSIFRMETGGWKMVHRHADPIAAVQPPEAMRER